MKTERAGIKLRALSCNSIYLDLDDNFAFLLMSCVTGFPFKIDIKVTFKNKYT
jgi:hypothetical protein